MKAFLAAAIVALLALPDQIAAQSQQAQSSAPQVQPNTAFPRLTLSELRKRYGDAQSRYITIRGVEVHYKDEGPKGNGVPVLFMVHGSESSLRTWDRIAALLKRRYRIIRYDVPGYGLSGAVSDEAASSVQPVDIAEELLGRLGVNRATAIGVSSGGTLCMYLASKNPNLVERLILSNTPSDPVKTTHLVQPQSLIDAQARAVQTGFRDRAFWDVFLTYFAGVPQRISVGTRDEYYDFNRRVPEKNQLVLVAKIGDGKQATIEMAKIRAPTLLVWGTADPLLPEAAADSISHHLSGTQVSRVLLPDVGHYPPLEVPDRFAHLITTYIENVIQSPIK